jgi:hypothetical protein
MLKQHPARMLGQVLEPELVLLQVSVPVMTILSKQSYGNTVT